MPVIENDDIIENFENNHQMDSITTNKNNLEFETIEITQKNHSCKVMKRRINLKNKKCPLKLLKTVNVIGALKYYFYKYY